MTETTKLAILAILVIATALSGCISEEKNDGTIESMVQLEAILTDPEFSEDNAEMMAAAAVEIEAITGEKYELNSKTNVTPIVDETKYTFAYSLLDQSSSPLEGIGWFKIVSTGVFERDNTTRSGFTDPSIDNIVSIEVFINNESVYEYVPIEGERQKITTTIVGDWYIRLEVTLKDGTIITTGSSSGGWGMDDMSDHPDYKKSEITVTGSGPFDARYIETDDKAMTRSEAKALCEELGIVWGDDRDIPDTKPTLTSTKVTPTVTPTIASTPESTFPKTYRIKASIFRTQWNENTIAFLGVNAITGEDYGIRALTYIEISIDGQVIAEFEPNIVKGRCGYIIEECPMIINLPNGITNSGEITVIGTFDWGETSTFKSGDHVVQVYCQTPPMDYEEEYSTYPVWNQ